MVQLVNVHSVLRLNCETLRDFIGSPSVAKLIQAMRRQAVRWGGTSAFGVSPGYRTGKSEVNNDCH
jgi:hypothetical protein